MVIDDGPHHIEAYKNNFLGKICIFHAPWNRTTREDNKQTFRVHDWYEFAQLLEKIKFISPFRTLLEEIDTIP